MTLTDLIIKHEGKRLKPYVDTVGKLTIGVGRNLTDVGISDEEARLLLANDIILSSEYLGKYSWFERLDGVRRAACIDLMFNIGPARFKDFKLMIVALDEGNWKEAARQLLDSVYAVQVKQRALDLARMVEFGEYPD